MAATSEPRTLEEMHSRNLLARRRVEAAARAHRLKKARTLVERSHAALERMRHTSAGRAALAEAVPPADRAPPFDPAEVFEILDPEKLAREPKRIIARIAAEHGFTAADILGPRRQVGLVAARHAAVAEVAREHPALTYADIGRIFRRDHSTIINAMRRAGAPIAPPPEQPSPWIVPGSPEAILHDVARARGLTVGQVRGSNRVHGALEARRAAIIAIAAVHPQMSRSAIGGLVGRDPTSVPAVLRRARPVLADKAGARTARTSSPTPATLDTETV